MKMVKTLEQLATHLYNNILKIHELREQRNSRYRVDSSQPARLYPFESGQICENYSRSQFWDLAMSGHNFSEFFEKRPVWLFASDHIAIHHGCVCDTLFICNDYDMDPQEDPWRLCAGLPDEFYGLAFIENPLVRFCMHLKHYNVSLRFNQTGHFRGVWSIGPQMIEHVLLNDHSWYMQSQTQKYAGIKLAVGFQTLFEYEWADELHLWIDAKLKEHENHNMLRCLSDFLHRTNRWGALYRQEPLSINKGNFNHWIDRHVYLEESAWGYFQKHPELKQLLHERYADDYANFADLVDVEIEDIDTYEHMMHHVEGWGMEQW